MCAAACAGLGMAALVLFSVSTSDIVAQNAPATRKVVYKVVPKYPPELKQNAIGGVVRLSVSVSPSGSVERIRTLGGNPILVDAAATAVKQWKYAPSDRSTTTDVQLDFIPHQ
jgi:TonB family protein